MTRSEIRRRFDEIVAFAEVEKFLDTPVKRYSSGMQVRLAFAVAAHLEPEILIIDEVLAVGDVEFQRKCLGKMEAASRSGRTVLFVSHNMAAVRRLCSRAVYLRAGKVRGVGGADEMVGQYLLEASRGEARTLAGGITLGELQLLRFELAPNPVDSGQSLEFLVELRAAQSVRLRELAVLVHSADGSRIAILDLRGCGLPASLEAGELWVGRGSIKAVPLIEGEYQVGLYACAGEFKGNLPDLLLLGVRPRGGNGLHTAYAPAYRGVLELDFEAERLNTGPRCACVQ